MSVLIAMGVDAAYGEPFSSSVWSSESRVECRWCAMALLGWAATGLKLSGEKLSCDRCRREHGDCVVGYGLCPASRLFRSKGDAVRGIGSSMRLSPAPRDSSLNTLMPIVASPAGRSKENAVVIFPQLLLHLQIQ